MGYQWIGAVHEVIPQEGHIVYSDIAVTHRKLHPSDPDRNLRIFEKLLKEGRLWILAKNFIMDGSSIITAVGKKLLGYLQLF